MTDFNSSLPVRTETNGDVAAKIVDKTTVANAASVNAAGELSVQPFQATASNLRAEVNINSTNNLVKVTDGVETAAVDVNNSLQVNQRSGDVWNVNVTSQTSAFEVHDYNTAPTIGVGSPNTHTYTVTAGKTLLLRMVQASGSGKIKVEVKTGPTGSTVSKAVGFTSTSNPNVVFEFPKPIEVAATDVVEVVRTNRDNASQDLYSYINGEEV